MPEQRQEVANQRDAIAVRWTLLRQQVDGEPSVDNELETVAIEKALADRMQRTLEEMRRLESAGVAASPYLELGAERCQRFLVIGDDLGGHGAAANISLDMLDGRRYHPGVYGRPEGPFRVCCLTRGRVGRVLPGTHR